jgi:hypothetical protein
MNTIGITDLPYLLPTREERIKQARERVIEQNPHAIFDLEPFTKNYPSPVNLERWQTQINRIVGQSVDGRPLLRIVWGMDEHLLVFRPFPNGEPGYGMKYVYSGEFIEHELQQEITTEKGEIKNLGAVSYERVEVGIPRFIIEQLHVDEEYRQSHEDQRYHWMDGVLVDILGPAPAEGFYSEVFTIASHDERCCGGKEWFHKKETGPQGERITHGQERCFGGYRVPLERDLKRIRHMKQMRDRQPFQHMPGQRIPDHVKAQAARDARTRQEQEEAKMKARYRSAIDDWFQTHGHRFKTDDPGVHSNGRYHFFQNNPLASDKKIVLTDE